MKLQWILLVTLLASMVVRGHAAANDNGNTKSLKDSVTFVFGTPVDRGVRVRCISHGDLTSLAHTGLNCTTSYEPEDNSSLSASSPASDDGRELVGLEEKSLFPNGPPTLVATKEVTGADGVIVHIIVMPRI